MKKIFTIVALCFMAIGIQAQEPALNLFANGFSSPVDLQHAGDDRLFVVEQGGRIKVLNSDGSVNATPFLDISTSVSNGSEQGLLGLAFHPDYDTNGFFYVNYTKVNGDTRVSRFSVDPGDPDVALTGSELIIIEYTQPFPNHNGGGVQFGPDGYLYISSGDGGSGGDPGNRAQNTTILLGKLLRLDVDNPSGGNNYGIPADNPFAGSAVNAEEIWAYGLRNPWRFSFDSATGDVWIGDVGQGDVEEIDKAAGNEAGLNYGWRCYEGSSPFNTSGCPPMGDLTFPIAEYSSSTGSGNCSITGGYVYRGSEYPWIQGIYYAADVCSGNIYTVGTTGNLINHGSFGGSWVAFGEDVTGEMYIVDIGGSIYKVEDNSLIGFSDNVLSDFSIIPNPASEIVHILSDSDTISSYSVYDLKGSELLSEKNIKQSRTTIAVNAISPGLYLLKVTGTDGTSVVKKLVIR
jgi:glucose/arabinose dehydrogenase